MTNRSSFFFTLNGWYVAIFRSLLLLSSLFIVIDNGTKWKQSMRSGHSATIEHNGKINKLLHLLSWREQVQVPTSNKYNRVRNMRQTWCAERIIALFLIRLRLQYMHYVRSQCVCVFTSSVHFVCVCVWMHDADAVIGSCVCDSTTKQVIRVVQRQDQEWNIQWNR